MGRRKKVRGVIIRDNNPVTQEEKDIKRRNNQTYEKHLKEMHREAVKRAKLASDEHAYQDAFYDTPFGIDHGINSGCNAHRKQVSTNSGRKRQRYVEAMGNRIPDASLSDLKQPKEPKLSEQTVKLASEKSSSKVANS